MTNWYNELPLFAKFSDPTKPYNMIKERTLLRRNKWESIEHEFYFFHTGTVDLLRHWNEKLCKISYQSI